MDRSLAFCVTLLGVGGAAFLAGLLMGFGLLPDPTAGHLARPLWGVLAIAGLLYGIVGAWLRMTRPVDGATSEVMVGYVLFHAHRPALALASLASLLFLVGWVGLTLGLLGPWAGPFSPASTDWTLPLGLSAAALFLALLGALAGFWSRGRGTGARKASALRGLSAASVLALLPWALRAAFIP